MSDCRVCTATTDGFVCKACCSELERAIGDMTSLMHEVSVVATGQTRVYRANGRADNAEEERAWDDEQAALPARLRSREGRIALPATRLMVRLDARELLWEAGNTLSTWARHLAESRGVELPTSTTLIPWLLAAVQSFRFDEAGAEAFDEITYLHARLTSAVDRSASRVYAGPCQTEGCKQPGSDGEWVQSDLYAPWKPSSGDSEQADNRDDREFVCDGWRASGVGCGAAYTWASRRPWLTENVRTSLVSIDDLLMALPDLFPELKVPPRASVNGWIRDKLIEPRGQDPVTGEPLFVGAEVLTRIENYKPKTYAPRPNRRCA